MSAYALCEPLHSKVSISYLIVSQIVEYLKVNMVEVTLLNHFDALC